MGTTVTTNVSNALNVDVVEDYTTNGINIVGSYTEGKIAYLNKLTKEKEQLAASTLRLNAQIIANNATTVENTARDTEIDSIITVVGAL